MSIDTIQSLGIDTEELREELLDILAKFDKTMGLQELHGRSELSPGRATTAAALGDLIKSGQVQRILSPGSHKALYRLIENAVADAPATKATTAPRSQPTALEPAAQAAPPEHKRSSSLRERIRAHLTACTQPQSSAQIAQAIGNTRGHKVGKALWDMVRAGEANQQPGADRKWLWSAPEGGFAGRAQAAHGSVKCRVIDYLAAAGQALNTREIADGLGGLPVNSVSTVLTRLARQGQVERESKTGGPHCLWRWIGGEAPAAKHTPQTPLPAPAPLPPKPPAPTPVPAVGRNSEAYCAAGQGAPVQEWPKWLKDIPAPAKPAVAPPVAPSAPAVDWRLTAAGDLVLTGSAGEMSLSARESLALHRFLNALHLHELIGLQEERSWG